MMTSELHATDCELNLRTIFQHSATGILLLAHDGIIRMANPVVYKIFGYEDDNELSGVPIGRLISGIDFYKAEAENYEDMPRPREFPAKHKDGHFFRVKISLGPYIINGEELNAVFITAIGQQTVARQIVDGEEKWLRFLVEAMSRLWQITDLREGLQEVLATAMQLLATEKGNVQLLDPMKQVLVIAAQKGFEKEFLDHFAEVSATCNSVCGQAFKAHKQIVVDNVDEDIYFAPHLRIARNAGIKAIQSTPLYDYQGRPVAMISTHSAEPDHFDELGLRRMEIYARYAETFLERTRYQERSRLDLEERVRERTEELADALVREKELNNMKSAFVSMASHEFRTPLTAIVSSVDLIRKYDQTEQQPQRVRHLERVRGLSRQLVSLLDDFLSIGKLEDGRMAVEPEDIDLNALLQEIVSELGGMCKEHQTIRSSYIGSRETRLDKKIVRNILLNLLSNAIKYSDEDIDLVAVITDGQIMLTVTDRGIGIPEDQQKNLFGKFFRAGNVGNVHGTGLGLNIVKLYVELLQGSISFKSVENVGTIFTVILPNRFKSNEV